MKKVILSIFVVMLSFVLFSCSEGDYDPSHDDSSNDSETILLADENLPERKIIYTVNMTFDVKNLDDAEDYLKSLVASDEWFDQESTGETRYSYTVRIKTERLDAFVDALQDKYVTRSFNKEADDISLAYQDANNRILALEAQYDRLVELYEEASLSDMIIINQQMSEIEVELQKLQGTINQYDSLVDYSEVHITFYGSTIVTRQPFFNRLANGFVKGVDTLVIFFDAISIIIAFLLPFAIVFGGVGVGAYFGYKKISKRNKLKKETKLKKKDY